MNRIKRYYPECERNALKGLTSKSNAMENPLNPIVFVKESWSFMQGYPKWKVALYMPIAYAKCVFYKLTGV